MTIDASLLSVLEGLSVNVRRTFISVRRKVVSVRMKVVSVRRKVVSDNDQRYFCAVFFPVCGLTGLRRTIVTVVVLKQPFQFFFFFF